MSSYQTLLGLSDSDTDYIKTNNLISDSIITNSLNIGLLTPSQLIGTDIMRNVKSIPMIAGTLLIGTGTSYVVSALTSGTNMNIVSSSGAITINTALIPVFSRVITNTTYTVDNTMTTAQIQAIISNTQYSVVNFEIGTYSLTSYLNVNRNDLILNGNGCTLYIGKFVQEPVIIIGDLTTNPPTTSYNNIIIKNFKIDGNSAFQYSETSITHYWIYNNCIGILNSINCVVEDCHLFKARSGGLTITNSSSKIIVRNCKAYSNYFDGLTCYGSQNISFIGNICYSHSTGAGISIDTGNTGFIITNNHLIYNSTGIFARWTDNCIFNNNVISNNTNGIFGSGYNAIIDNGITKWNISNNVFSNNTSTAIFVQGIQDSNITNNTISNTPTGIALHTYGGSPFNTYGVSKGVNVSCNTLTSCSSFGVYFNPENIPANGAVNNTWVDNVFRNNTTNINGYYGGFNIIDSDIITSKVLTLFNGANYVNIQASAVGSCSFVYPPTNGTSGSILTTNGTITSWKPPPALALYTSASAFSTSSLSYVATPITMTITPTYTSSRIKITIMATAAITTGDSALYTIYRNSTNLSPNAFTWATNTYTMTLVYVDAPTTTSSTSYTLYMNVNSGIGYILGTPMTNNIILEEIF
jgi:hypothetical protein